MDSTRLWRGREVQTNLEEQRALSERSELRSRQIRQASMGIRQGPRRGGMVLGPFAETKGPRPPGRNPDEK